MASKATSLMLAGIGSVIVFSGLKGWKWSQTLRNVISGQKPESGQIDPATGKPVNAISGMNLAAYYAYGYGINGNNAPVNAQGLVNPIGKGLTRGRIDEGVDFAGAGPLYAITSGRITSVHGPWPAGVYISLHGDDKQWYYYAENITPAVHVGQRVSAGQLIGHAAGVYPFIEIGYGSAVPFTPAAHSHYTEGVPTPEGQQFARLLSQLGAP